MSEDLLARAEEACRAARRALRAKDEATARERIDASVLALRNAPGLVAPPTLPQVGDPKPNVARASDVYHRLSSALRDLGEQDRAIECARRSVELERMAGRPLLLGNHLLYLANLRGARGDAVDAYRSAREGYSLLRARYGADHPETQLAERAVRAFAEELSRTSGG